MNPDEIIVFERHEADQYDEYAKKGIMYGSACYTDMDLAFDGLLELFEAGYGVEDALHILAIKGYDMGTFNYDLSEDELFDREIQEELYEFWD